MSHDENDKDKAHAPGNPLAEHPKQPAQEIVDPRDPEADQGPYIEIAGKDEATRGIR